jgi:hypothetical protein
MSNGIAHRYALDYVLRRGDVAPSDFDPPDITVSCEPDIE